MALQVGSPAPDFTLKTMTAEGLADRNLAAHNGKDNVVLLFFPAAFTGVCTTEMCDATAGLGAFQNLGATLYGISVDSAFAQNAWKAQNSIGFDLLSDYAHKTVQAYDIVLPDLAGLGPSSQRAVFLIDKAGVIRYVEVTENPGVAPNFEALKQALESL